jgi:hypothetical protein
VQSLYCLIPNIPKVENYAMVYLSSLYFNYTEVLNNKYLFIFFRTLEIQVLKNQLQKIKKLFFFGPVISIGKTSSLELARLLL